MDAGATAGGRWSEVAAAAAAGALLLAVALHAVPGVPAPSGSGTGELGATIAQAPLAFEPNAGRSDPRVEFSARSVAGGTLYLTTRRAILSLPQPSGDPEALRLGFSGASPHPVVRGTDELPGKVNSFIGDDPAKWRSGIPTYARVRYESLYPGVDLDFYGNQRDLEYDFRVAPRADPSQIAIELSGTDSPRLAPNGDLIVDVGRATVRQKAPFAYQEVRGERRKVRSAYELSGSTVGFRLGPYERSLPLVIDPLVLGYSTYLGGGAADIGNGIAVDSTGAAYVTGSTSSTDFPTDPAQVDPPGGDVFVTKLIPDGGGAASLAYSTYLGGGDAESGFEVAVDSTGAAYVTGRTDSTDFPLQDPFQSDQTGTDAFVTKLNPDSGGAVTLAYSTYLGGAGLDTGQDIAVDSAGGAYIAGRTASTVFPTADALLGDQPGDDGFVTKLDPDPGGTNPVTIAYSTYLGGNGAVEQATGVAVDSTGAAYVTGFTESSDFPVQDQFQTDQTGRDAFATKIAPDAGGATLVSLAYSTYLGGAGADQGFAVAVDSAGGAYVTGDSDSTDFPTSDSFQTDQGGTDAFVTKVAPDAGSTVALAYSSYLGGSGFDEGFGVAVDSAGAAYLAGLTSSTNFPTLDAFQADQTAQDGFVTKVAADPGGATPVALAYSTYLGGSSIDQVTAIDVDSAGAAYVTGDTSSTNFPTQDQFQGDQTAGDAFVARLVHSPPPPDGDGDGVPDSTDACPAQAGPASNNGCPVATTPPPADGDGDGDGVPDSTDACPSQAGPASGNGCPVAVDDSACEKAEQRLDKAKKRLRKLKQNDASKEAIAKAKKKVKKAKQAKKEACDS